MVANMKYVTVRKMEDGSMNKKDVKYNPYYNFIIEGTGDIIIGQMPEAGESIIEGGTVILYT